MSEIRFSLIVPCYNEESVIEKTIRNLLSLQYPRSNIEIVAVDDLSSDASFDILHSIEIENKDILMVVQTNLDNAHTGKSSCLNTAFSILLEQSKFKNDPNWVIGVFDADSVPDRDMLLEVSRLFLADMKIGAVQSSIGIYNESHSLLTRAQSAEFAGFSRVTQLFRWKTTRSSSLGGNVQFVRAKCLRELALVDGKYWDESCITEDLELSMRMSMSNWDIAPLYKSFTYQEAPTNIAALFKQRLRWAWGTVHVFHKYILSGKIFTKSFSSKKKIDMILILSLMPLSILFASTTLLMIIGMFYFHFPNIFSLMFSFIYLPFASYGLASSREHHGKNILFDTVLFFIFSYHWVPLVPIAIWKEIKSEKPVWNKTIHNGNITVGLRDDGERSELVQVHRKGERSGGLEV